MKEELSSKYIVDIDGTICETKDGDYENAVPYKDRIKKLNELYDKGNRIIYYTARGSENGKSWSELTRKQLKEWGVKYHSLGFDKLYGDYYIDDKAINIKDFF